MRHVWDNQVLQHAETRRRGRPSSSFYAPVDVARDLLLVLRVAGKLVGSTVWPSVGAMTQTSDETSDLSCSVHSPQCRVWRGVAPVWGECLLLSSQCAVHTQHRQVKASNSSKPLEPPLRHARKLLCCTKDCAHSERASEPCVAGLALPRVQHAYESTSEIAMRATVGPCARPRRVPCGRGPCAYRTYCRIRRYQLITY